MKNVYLWYKIGNLLYKKNMFLLSKIVTFLIRFIFAGYIPCSCTIGEKTKLAYGGLGVVIHNRAKIGSNCVIAQNVTIGGTTKKSEVPKIGDRVYIGAGAKIIGDVKIGSNCVIGANSVVINDIPDNSLAVGIPAKVIKNNIDINKYM